MALPVQQVLSSAYLQGIATADTPPTGDSSQRVPTTNWVNAAISAAITANASANPKVSQGTGINQLTNQVKIGWSAGSQLLCTVDNTNLGNFLFGTDYTNLQNQITTINNKPFAYTGINQNVSFLSIGANGDLNVAGTIVCNNDIWAFASDRRLKEDISPIKDALAKLRKITGVTFKFNELAREKGIKADREQVGFIAQDVNEVLPQAVALSGFDKDENGESISGENYLTIQYDKIGALIVEALKELEDRVAALENK